MKSTLMNGVLEITDELDSVMYDLLQLYVTVLMGRTLSNRQIRTQ